MKGRKCGLLLAVTKQIIRNNPCAHKWCCAIYRVAVGLLVGEYYANGIVWVYILMA